MQVKFIKIDALFYFVFKLGQTDIAVAVEGSSLTTKKLIGCLQTDSVLTDGHHVPTGTGRDVFSSFIALEMC